MKGLFVELWPLQWWIERGPGLELELESLLLELEEVRM